MKISDLNKQIRYLDLITNRKVTEIFSGNYKSSFKGNGMEFEDIREYIYGDDIKNIDWNISAREGKAYIKKYREERELTTMFLIDISGKMNFGTQEFLKSEIALKIVAILGFSTIKNNDKLGGILYLDNIYKDIPFKKGKVHTLRFLRDIIIGFKENKKNKSNLKKALKHLNRIVKKKTICFLITDDIDFEAEKDLIITNKRHDLVIIRIQDLFETNIENFNGLISFQDPESLKISDIELNPKLKSDYIEYRNRKEEKIKKFSLSNKIDILNIKTTDNITKKLIELFKKRQKRY